MPAFKGLDEYFLKNYDAYKAIFDSEEAHEEPLPGEWNNKLNILVKIILLKTFRSDKVTLAI